MKTFFFKLIRVAAVGVVLSLLVVVTYITLDPFKVIRDYNPIFLGNVKGEVIGSRDYVGTVTLLNNYKKVPYESFVFGNSRSLVFEVDEWQKHLQSGSQILHYNAPSEALYAITKKVEFIDKKGLSIKNVLLVVDYETLVRDTPNSGHLYIISPQLVDHENIFDFHLTFFNAFLTPEFLQAYLDFNITGELKPYMIDKYLLNCARRKYDEITNEVRMDYFEDLVEKGEFYTPEKLSLFYERDSLDRHHPPVIAESQTSLLGKIQQVFAKHNTDYKIVISPIYDQKKLHPDDIQYLRELFGDESVFDFSGRNEYTADYRNYYETSHYRPGVARAIMAQIYDMEGEVK